MSLAYEEAHAVVKESDRRVTLSRVCDSTRSRCVSVDTAGVNALLKPCTANDTVLLCYLFLPEALTVFGTP